MKMRKKISNAQLQTELVEILKNMFLPQKKMIKEQIEWLLEHNTSEEMNLRSTLSYIWRNFEYHDNIKNPNFGVLRQKVLTVCAREGLVDFDYINIKISALPNKKQTIFCQSH